jgi:diguanylate cyclase (GGDEF)-like protein
MRHAKTSTPRLSRGVRVTIGITGGLAVVAAGIAIFDRTHPTLAGAPPEWASWVALFVGFLLGELLLMNIEFRRQAHSLTLAGIPLVLGALLAPMHVVVAARVLGAGSAFLVQRVRPDKFAYNLAAYAFEAAVDTALIHVVLGNGAKLDPVGALAVLAIVVVIDQLMSCLVLLMISVHNASMSRRAMAEVLIPSLVLACVTTAAAVGVVLLHSAGRLGDAVVVVAAVTGVVMYRGYLGTTRRHAALELVHEFVAGTAGASSFADAARELLPRMRALLRAGTVEMLVLTCQPGDDARCATRIVDSEAGFRAETITDVAFDWATLRALSANEPLLAPRTSKDRALLGWLEERGYRDAMVVPFPGASGMAGTTTVSDRLGETATFTPDDLTLLQTLTGHLAVASTNARMVEQLAYDANHDALTGLANRSALVRRATEAACDDGSAVAVMLLDLDRFKEVNDALGHGAGDAVLKVVAERLQQVLPDTATIARLGGDEFAVHLCGLRGREHARAVGETVAAALARPVSIEGAVLTAEASIGIAVARSGTAAASSPELVRQADTAMYEAKSSDDPVAIYHPDMDRGRAENLALLADLRTTLRSHPEHFTVYFQPKIDLRTRRVVGAEALVRWNHPELGVLPPDRFIPLAEASGLIHQFTPLVLSRALTECRRWAVHGEPITVAVNVSARNVGDRTLPRRIAAALDEAGLPADRLVVEITESSILDEPDHALPVLTEIADLGVCISLDDFGTGYSSLSYLHRFPAREVKIDKSFVLGLARDGADASAALVSAIVNLGQSLDLRVVAEGAETPAVLDLLADLGCDCAQGYTIARPMTPEAFLDWLLNYRRVHAAPVQLVQAG